MTTWNKELALYIDADAPEGALCLLDGLSSTTRQASLYLLQGDKLTIKLVFQRRADSLLNAAENVELPMGAVIVLAGNPSPSLDSEDLLFSATDFVRAVSDDIVYYSATLDLNTLEIRELFLQEEATELPIKIDIEIENADNTERVTFQFDAVLKQQVYSGQANPTPGTPVYPQPGAIVLKQADGSFVRFMGAEQQIYLFHQGTNKFYPLILKEVDGIITVAPGEGVDP